ncbi:MAG: hypothetical protein FJX63_11050 [Alphaproteobacteria bacterium]|nr:hypothetical protein [Alphaproteobacteria bacterium]
MVRRAFAMAAILALTSATATAGSTSAGFGIGLRMVGKNGKSQAVTPARTYTWGAAAISVLKAGFDDPVRLAAEPGLYWFSAAREGLDYRIAVSSASGAIVRVERA